MKENILRVRRRCLFLLDDTVMAAALQRPELAREALTILCYLRQLKSTTADTAVPTELFLVMDRWAQQQQFADWQECVEWLFFVLEMSAQGQMTGKGTQSGEQGNKTIGDTVENICRDVLERLALLFAEEARAYNAAAHSFAENYWGRALKLQQQEGLLGNGDNATVNVAQHRVTWSVAAELPPLVEQVFLSP
ncbi:uncharacterized protein TM35_000132800 [Trypanosoma theileri]|uniref:Uncharacterized protein n=1 Tax=Trypanosoma theileri TaxID=67003 RepID=A0A1X0NX40_9TRYP|nr:uncharacterized protein TM35_000132800 [Trypanosoma theileri]ORC89276.1 hypothetical protein TM35_000132800 [Trypanosoma theileri]